MSHAITRLRSSGRWLDVISMAPLAISPVTLGLGLIVTFDTGWYDWRGEWWFVAVVHSIVAFPLAVRVMVPSWRAISPGLRDAAAVLGASPLRRLFNIELRLIWSSIIAASGLIAAVSLGEFGAASMLSRSGAETLPVAISRLLARTGDTVRAQAFALATLLVIACLTVLLIIDVAGSRSRVTHRGAHARGQ
jgi:thiamine transport system permease protein